MNPTTALFDAINRGSLNAAKEALNRGADMNARNVLDQTPLDMAIDLNRNDITFLLLSLRTYNPEGKLGNSTTHDEIETDTKGNGHLTIKGSSRAHGAQALAAGPSFDAKGGAAQPQIGFLGFAGR
jgi:ankyrin repeat protein